MNRLQPHETELIGGLIKTPSGVIEDEASRRIEWLVADVLSIVGIEKDSGGWETLYRDPVDGRYWLHTYPQSEYHGGGPPALRNILLTTEELQSRFVTPEQWERETEQFRRERNIRIISPKPSEDA